MRVAPLLRLAMTLIRSVYLCEILALLLGSLFSALSAEDAPDVRGVTDVSRQRSWDDARREARRKAPRFMVELYEEHIRNPGALQGGVVRSFTGQSNGAFHFFNLTSFTRGEKITKAEVRWFRRRRAVLPGHHFYRVDLYEVLDSRVNPWRGNLILSRLLSVYTEGWELFNITQTVTKWILNISTNRGILVVPTLPSRHWLETTSRERGYEENDTYLVIYSDDGRRSSGERGSSSGWNTNSPLELIEYKSSVQAAVRRRRSTHKSAAENLHAINCQRTPLYVDFVKLGWSGWIISPSGYNAYHCTGSCPFPLSGGLRATNHAIVQSIVNTLKLSSRVGRPCCVPDNLQPISLLYFDDEENVVLKQYDDMVAGSCGCH
ncbi:bone morphogenetic protein 2 [Clarias gariepinus]|uniref:bone morphogenetic protein 2-like n=1 Tax=Clarias gariepinus TaxID=13013 RepID=UPI00234D01CD|nr:bone morphogenetic protein 2-like [Clarias gariepinus]